MNSGNWRERADRLRLIPLESVLRSFAAKPDLYDSSKWHTAESVVSVTGTKFIDWKRGIGGGGAIDLTMHLHPCGFGQALQWLELHFPQSVPNRAASTSLCAQLQLPLAHRQYLPRVQRYLSHQRRLPPELLRTLIDVGDIYADRRANAVFILRDPKGRIVGAELRGTSSIHWRGMAPGSRKDDGYFSLPPRFDPPPTSPTHSAAPIILCESAIDALSCALLHPGHQCISSAGARPNPRWLIALVRTRAPIFCGFDTDETGETMAQAMIHLHPSIQRLRPQLHDWNDVLTALS